ncbi:MAG: hypothetical protein AAF206_30935, partial [Bacteroidota bacterium]
TTSNNDVLRPYSLNQFQFIPVQGRARIGRIASVGVGAGFSYLFNAKKDERVVVNASRIDDAAFRRIDPLGFADLQLGNSRKGPNLGFRMLFRMQAIEDVLPSPYRSSQLYVNWVF